ncbi:serine/threonine protein kinase [Paracoccus lutimaris]|uniref:Serine/threonine protein kinase n=1 Tax=Paracoccus lutimaris TaxID=1490030 RepID=A0A368Z983_9RHOB|nr:serine/threonine-protein kinase [Paracoccus lutimaris]RCW89012.1 serine/threonine protein kinase [Paracoccus lutimaris]
MKDPLPSDIFKPGQILNNTYEIIGILGRGGTGEVYLAHNQVVERDVAIKALNQQFSANADYLDLMKREEQMRNIIHDAVVRYSECSRSDSGQVFLVMDHIEGPSLNQVMLERRLDDRALMIVAHRVLEGLAATHGRGIVHRDLSPDNIILRDGRPERATIIDFGIAKDTAAGARTIVGNEFAGKYEYAAPEQLDGKADYRSDFYGLGALLLAAAREEVPRVGTSPGEVVRFKRRALDTSGLAAPLKDLIDWLTDPDPARRPQSAAEALERLERWLKPDTQRDKPAESGRKKRRLLLPAALAAALAVAGGLWATGYFTPALPEANPYLLTASLVPGAGGTLTGNAPDGETAAALRNAFRDASGSPPPENALTLATGMPDKTWPGDVAKLLALAAPLSRWEISVTGNTARLAGIAPDTATRDAMQAGLAEWPSPGGMTLQAELVAGPETLGWAALQPYLDRLATCGALTAPADQPGEFALLDTITLTGSLARPQDAETIRSTLAPVIGDRSLEIQAQVLNEDLCRIRSVLPPVPAGAMSIWLGRGATGEAALTGVFQTGDNPVVDIQFPANITGASLWVMVVDNTGKVFHVLPNINQTDAMVDDLGQVDNGIRRVRVLWSLEQLKEDASRLAVQVSEGDYGKSEVIAILSKTPLFDLRRPRDESVNSVAEALAETLKGREDQIIGVASRIIDARQ